MGSCVGDNMIYVAVDGNDDGSGKLNDPFMSIERARDYIRDKRLGKTEDRQYTILLREGSYNIEQTIHFTDKDYNITIQPFRDEYVTLTGSFSINPEQVIPVAGSDKEEIFPETNRDKVFMVSLKDLHIEDYGQLEPFGFGRPATPTAMEIFINGKPGHLSRWPNDSSVNIEKVIYSGSSPDDKKNEGAIFTHKGDRPYGWKYPEKVWIAGYFRYGWADDALRLSSIDPIKKHITTLHPHRYGFESGNPWNQWYAYNIVEEIDAPGEYYIDRDEGILYFYDSGIISSLEVSLLEVPFIEMVASSNITVEGIVFEGARGSAVELYGTSNCIFSDCTFRNLGSFAVSIENATNVSKHQQQLFSSNNGIVNCIIYDTGKGGIILSGGERNTLTPAHNYVHNCTIHDFNRLTKTYSAGIKISGVGNQISHNEIFNAPHVAILLSGNDHLIEYNEIHHVCMETDDVGAIYYGRNPSERGHLVQYNFIHNLPDKYRTTGIYHDDGACGMKVHGNVLYKAGTFPVLIGGGSDNPYTNNIFIDCAVGIKVDNRLQAFDWAKPMIARGGVIDQRLKEVNFDQPPYSIRYPELAKYWEEDPSFPKRNLVDRNLFVNVEEVVLKIDERVNADKDFLDFTTNNLITNEDPGFVDKDNMNFKLMETSTVLEDISGFEAIPFEKIGTYEIIDNEETTQ